MSEQSEVINSPDLDYEAELCGTIEQALKALHGYGIMALELIQNADDAGATTLTIDARDDALVVRNNEVFSRCSLSKKSCDWEFDNPVDDGSGQRRLCNFHAIARLGGRSKLGSENQTGRFGIGFVSVYQITDTPIIRSAGVEYTLIPTERKAARRDIESSAGTEFVLPWAFAQSPIRNAIHEAVVPANIAELVVAEIVASLPTSVLFLRNLRQIVVQRAGALRLSITIEPTSTGIDLLFGPSGERQRWLVQTRDANDIVDKERLYARFPGLRPLNRSTIVSVAIPAGFEIEKGLLYAYLPTKQTTGLPLHINADFFPHASRRDIVLESESHERFWNEAMLAAAAEIISERFDVLREALGHKALWRLGEASRAIASNRPYAGFWSNFSSAAKATESVWTLEGSWRHASEVRLPSVLMGELEQAALSDFGVGVLHPSLREYSNALMMVGVQHLKLDDVTAAIKCLDNSKISSENAYLKGLWSAVNSILEPRQSPGKVIFRTPLGELGTIPFLLDQNGMPISPDGAWRLPDNVPSELIQRVFPDIPLLHPDALEFANLLAHIDLLGLDEFAKTVAQDVPDEATGAELLGGPGDRLRDLYRLFTIFWREPQPTKAGNILAHVPILRNYDGSFTTPSRAQLPGGFSDPTGWFQLVDTSAFPPGMDRFAEVVLDVGSMTFSDFIENHFADALERGVTLEQYRALLAEIADHRHELGDVIECLSELPFIWNKAGELVRPRECYFLDPSIEAILGNNPALWVDPKALPKDKTQQKILRDLFEARLGMPTTVAAEHIFDRIEHIAESFSPVEARKALTPIFRHLVEVWPKLDDEYRDELASIADLAFLPVQFDGEADDDTLHFPGDAYRAGRAPGFSSQVPIVDLAPLRTGTRAANELLALIGVEEEPDTATVVDHLIHCIESGRQPHQLTYQILGERCEAEDDLGEIDRLAELPFIYDSTLGFLTAEVIFWSDPPIGRYWHKASRAMSERPALFTRLGVCVSPEPRHYAELAMRIAAADIRQSDHFTVHSRCLYHLAEALQIDVEGARDAIEEIAKEESLLAIAGNSIWPADALWVDSEQHLSPFMGALDSIAVVPPLGCDLTTNRKFYSNLSATPLSKEVSLELAEVPDAKPDPSATEVIRNKATLLLRLPPTAEARTALSRLIDGLSIRLAPHLLTQAELRRNDVVYRSEPVSSDAFLDTAGQLLYVAGNRVKWVVVAKQLFEALAPLCPSHDMRSLAGTAASVLQAPTYEDAEDILVSLGYEALVYVDGDLPASEELTGPFENDEHDDAAVREQVGEIHGHQNELGPEQETESDTFPRQEGDDLLTSNCGDDEAVEPTDDAQDNPYTSKTSGGNLADETSPITERDGAGHSAPLSKAGQNQGSSPLAPERPISGREPQDRASRKESRKRRSRLLSYVVSDDYSSAERDDSLEAEDGADDETGAAAVEAVLEFETFQGRSPIEQDHYNPGFDVESKDDSGARRLIEVKGIDGDWNEAGVKLSRRQYRFAQEHPEEFWLYVVENARDPARRRVRPLWNPFLRVDGYFFDHEWQKACEVGATSSEMALKVGAKVQDHRWGEGVISKIKVRGITKEIVVDFKIFGLKMVPLSQLNIVG
jgi:hypothetical protein